MLFKLKTLSKIKKGEISLAFRKWVKPMVKEGSRIHTPIGLLSIISVSEIQSSGIKNEELLQAGFENIEELEKYIEPKKKGRLYRIEFVWAGEDPRIALRENDDLTTAEVEELKKKFTRWDRASAKGPWTKKIMELIQSNPGKRAQDLADGAGMEKSWLKIQVRKLKNLGLTESLKVGYRISPRGESFLKEL